MRVLLCNIHCPPFICFCKPSSAAAHLYTPGPLKLENTPLPHVTSTLVSVVTHHDTTSHQLSGGGGEATEAKEASSESDGNQQQQQQQAENPLKSCIRKPCAEHKEVEKKKVQWIDNMGKELVEIKEFESSDTRDTNNKHENRSCVCIIL
ncbi:hypothetical protein CsSME_00047595 [Camellia sinensis var. sinensis]|uniref:uncharacterized protein LOC114266549 isoform X2 n=1 Tax=Camellia sinensis TaxID=4442 RepID=UPI001036D1D1|nr:uncharacterized protein LOC114266549 isoform X2 [Camellia sinensis]XP_028063256.1 uncharacterized protein LOC114266549 isoform X3 [Camellia sinensis]